MIQRTGVDRDAAVQEQEAADERKSGGGGRALLQTIKLMEVPGNRGAVHLQQVNRETTRVTMETDVSGEGGLTLHLTQLHLDEDIVVVFGSFKNGETSSIHNSGEDQIHSAPW